MIEPVQKTDEDTKTKYQMLTALGFMIALIFVGPACVAIIYTKAIKELRQKVSTLETAPNLEAEAYRLASEHWLAQTNTMREYERGVEFSPDEEPNTFTFYLDHNGNEVGVWSETWVFEYHVVQHENENPSIEVVRQNAQTYL
jgi:hypothetical protein